MARQPIFLERARYRRRRLGDAARLLPVLGAVLFAFPILWAGHRTVGGLVYIFGAWAVLILGTALISRRLGGRGPDDAPQGDDADRTGGGRG